MIVMGANGVLGLFLLPPPVPPIKTTQIDVGKVGGPCAIPASAGREGEPPLTKALKEPDQEVRFQKLGAECRAGPRR
jgi:hypothetical protein